MLDLLLTYEPKENLESYLEDSLGLLQLLTHFSPEANLADNSFVESVLNVLDYLFKKTDDIFHQKEKGVLSTFHLLVGYCTLSSSDENLIRLTRQRRPSQKQSDWLACLLAAVVNYTEFIVPLQPDDQNAFFAKLCLENLENDLAPCEIEPDCQDLLDKLSSEQSLLDLLDYLVLQSTYLKNKKTAILFKESIFCKPVSYFRERCQFHKECLEIYENYLQTLCLGLIANNLTPKPSSPVHLDNVLATSPAKFKLSKDACNKAFLKTAALLIEKHPSAVNSAILDVLRSNILANLDDTSNVLLPFASKPDLLEGIFSDKTPSQVHGIRARILMARLMNCTSEKEVNSLFQLLTTSWHKVNENGFTLIESADLDLYAAVVDPDYQLPTVKIDPNSAAGRFLSAPELNISKEERASLVCDFMDIDQQVSTWLSFVPASEKKGWLRTLGEKMADVKGFKNQNLRLCNIAIASLPPTELQNLDASNLCPKIVSALESLEQKNTIVKGWVEEAKSSVVIKQLMAKQQDLDVELFQSDTEYRNRTILQLSKTEPNLGLKLGSRYGISAEDVLTARLGYLMTEVQFEPGNCTSWEKKLSSFFTKLCSQFSEEKLLSHLHEKLFDSIIECSVFRVLKLLRIMDQQLSIPPLELFQDIPFETHLRVLNLLSQNQNWLHKVPYSTFFTKEMDSLVKDEHSSKILSEFLTILKPFKPELASKASSIMVQLATSLLEEIMNTDTRSSVKDSLALDRLQAVLFTMSMEEMRKWLENVLMVEEFPLTENAYKIKSVILESILVLLPSDE
ncbi:hypothetical protein Ciccas_010061 [Cichlidogyrus casuarinus]|uniref:Sec39 domain-containing protein n=1 Tax=Cichlidogyrus casuarinus TaxID=1844966 RepID=A0ABD2PW96_9PLAT